MKRKLFILLILVFAIIQFGRIDKTNPPIIAEEDFFAVETASPEIKSLIQTACYDCHSHTSSYPWYSNIAPVSWWLADHIKEGREHLNFSTWKTLNNEDRAHALHECEEVLEEKEMPMLPYMIAHNDAWLSDEQRLELTEYFKSIQ